MSGHRRVKDIDYDEDELEDYDEQQEEDSQTMSPEEKAQMRAGVLAVRDALGTVVAIADEKIEESLWYYYFDVNKTIAYLKKSLNPVEKPTPKSKSFSKPTAFDEALNRGHIDISTTLRPYKTKHQALNNASFDFSWAVLPSHRLGRITEMPNCQRGRLLGGSGNGQGASKPSKLAALAASRKKAKEQKNQNAQETLHRPRETPEPTTSPLSTSLLDRLSIHEQDSSGKEREQINQSNDKDGSSQDLARSAPRRYKRQKVQEEEPPKAVMPDNALCLEMERKDHQDFHANDLRAAPSMFATILAGDNPGAQMHTQQNPSYISVLPNSSTHNPFAEPNSDERVNSAQAKEKSQTRKPATKSTSDGLANGVAAVKLDDTPKVKSKNIDAAAAFEKLDQKKAANFVVIGHVDHGKSTLMGRLLYDLQHLSPRDHSRNQKLATETGKASFALAWALDSTAEERARGVTVDIATNTFATTLTDFTILDAPGHRDFIPNMIAGAAQADFAVLVIDAATNAFEAGLKGQTREHALLVRSMGISRVVVAINKMDAANWSQDRFDAIQQQMSGFLSSAGFSPKNVAYIPCAGLTGDNVAAPVASSKAPWYTGDTLIAALDASEPARRRLHDPLRLTVSDVYRTAAPGSSAPVSIVGRLDAGSLQIGTVILALPAGEAATVKSIEIDGTAREYAVAGQIASVGLVGIDAVHLRAGDVVCERSARGDGSGEIRCVKAFTAKCLAFEHVMPGPVEVLRGRLQSAARVTDLLELVDKAGSSADAEAQGGAEGQHQKEKTAKAKTKKRPRIVKPGQVVRLRVHVEAEKGLPLEAPDRIVLRSEGVTLAAGLLESVEVR